MLDLSQIGWLGIAFASVALGGDWFTLLFGRAHEPGAKPPPSAAGTGKSSNGRRASR